MCVFVCVHVQVCVKALCHVTAEGRITVTVLFPPVVGGHIEHIVVSKVGHFSADSG